MKSTAFLFVLVALLWSPLSVAAQTSPASSAQPAEINASVPVLKPGDVVRIAVWRQPEWSGEFEIGADGTIRHPLYREVVVAGVPISTAESRVRTFLSQYDEVPHFVMEPLFRVAVGGEVRQPQLYTFPPEMTISQAVAMAGGPTERGRLDRVRVVRDGGAVMEMDLTIPDAAAAQMSIRSGDQIIVGRRTNIMQEYILPGSTLVGTFLGLINLLLLY